MSSPLLIAGNLAGRITADWDSETSDFDRPGIVRSFSNDGMQALAFAEVHQPGFIVMDLRLYRMSPFIILERLRTAGCYSRAVVVSEEFAGVRAKQYLRMLGGKSFICKEWDKRGARLLLDVVRECEVAA